jgi:hypothetical protein
MTQLRPTVPALKPEAFCKDAASDGNGKRCLIGWRDYFFGTSYRVYRALSNAAMAIGDDEGVVRFNDAPETTQRMLSQAWAAAMEELGYLRAGDEFRLALP